MTQTPDRKKAPEIHSIGKLSLPYISEETLPNGVRLSVLNSGDMEVNRLTVALPGGEAEEPSPLLANLTNYLITEGCKDMTGAGIAEKLEFNGAWIKPLVHTHYRSLSLYSLNSTASTVIPMFGNILTSPSFPQDAFENIAGQAVERIRIDREKVSVLAGDELRGLAYGQDSPIARYATPESVAGISRCAIKDFYYRNLNSAGIHAFLAGKISEETAACVRDMLMAFPEGKEFERTPLGLSPSATLRRHVEKTGALQSAVKMAIPSIGRTHPDYVALRIAVIALGGYFGSRLMANIREEKGLTYGINSSLLGFPEKSYINVSTQTANENVDIVIHEVIAEMERMKDPASYTGKEIDRLSRHVISGLASSLDTPFSVMDFRGVELFADTPADYFYRQQEVASAITPQLLAETAGKYFDTSRMYVVSAGKKD